MSNTISEPSNLFMMIATLAANALKADRDDMPTFMETIQLIAENGLEALVE